ncbi:transposase [Rubellimicrobium aerolatum]|nr:transposase [Rubellimicrobium aerolatum]
MDGYLDGFADRLEVIEGRTGRRRWTEAEKARIVVESLMPGARVAEVARRHGTTRWHIYDWRRPRTTGSLEMLPRQDGWAARPLLRWWWIRRPSDPQSPTRRRRPPALSSRQSSTM